MGSCCSVTSVEEQESHKLFKTVDVNNDKKACREEIARFVASRPELWAMLSVNLNISEDECRSTATRVAMEVASGLVGQEALDTELTKQQFHDFRTKYMLNGQGAQEFFHRCVFASFDKDANNVLDPDELDAFLDTFYQAGSIFEGDARLPKKATLKKTILKKYSKRGDNMLTFDEIRDIIRGTGGAPASPTASPSPSPSPKKEQVAAAVEQPQEEDSSNKKKQRNANNGAARNRRPKKNMDVETSKSDKEQAVNGNGNGNANNISNGKGKANGGANKQPRKKKTGNPKAKAQ